jgi:hypothetical protein
MFKSFLETKLRVYTGGQGVVIISRKDKSERLAVVCNHGGKWQIETGGFDYARYIHHPLKLINLLLEQGVIKADKELHNEQI